MADKDKYKKPSWKMASITGAQTGLKEIFPGMGLKGGASKGKVKTKTKDKTYVKEQRNISGQKAEVSYTKSRWKSWKKTKSQQAQRKQAHVEAGKKRLQAKYPGFFKSKGK